MARPTITVGWQITIGGATYSETYTSDVLYPLSFSYGFGSSKPNMPNVAAPGYATFFFDNADAAFPYTIHDSDVAPGIRTGKRIGTNYRIKVAYDTDSTQFIGRVISWEPVPGLFEDRITEVGLSDYIGQLGSYNLTGLKVQGNANAADALESVASQEPFPGDVMPYSPTSYYYSSNGEVFTSVYHDMIDNQGKCIQPFINIAKSEIGHAYVYSDGVYYLTNDEWINLGKTNVGTLDNVFSNIDTVADREFEFSPIYVSYEPAKTSDSYEVLFTLNRQGHIKPNETTSLRLNYSDPNSGGVPISCVDTDVVSPVSGTDYLVSYTSGSTDNGASSDLTINLTNQGSAAELEFINGGSENLYLSLLQIRGKPVYYYGRETLFTSGATELQNSLSIDMPYQDDRDFTESALNYYSRIYSKGSTKNLAKSISFVATADSDLLTMAINARLGNTVHIKEDVNLIDDEYRIMNITWDIMEPDYIVVSWELYPDEYTTFHMVDESLVHLTDSDGKRFSFWR